MKSIQRRLFLPAAMALLVAACGGGGGGDTSAGPVPPASQPPTGPGSTKTVIVTGVIGGFGSVIVNGVRYDTSGTDVRIEDRAGTVAELRVGQVVRIEAQVDDKGGARARVIEQHRLLQGAVQSVNVANGTIAVAGQVVKVDDDTSFDDSIVGGSLDGIKVGDRLEVHGFASSSGLARATRIEKAEAGDLEVEARGLVSALDTVNRRFRVGTLNVDYSTATLDGFGTAGIREGDFIEVKGREVLADGTLKASRVHKEDGRIPSQSGNESEVEGLVTRFVSATDFDVAGQKVTTTGATIYTGGAASDLKLDIKVEAEGRLDSSGTLVAAKIVFKRASSVRLTASVEGVDTVAGTVKALGLTIVVDATTRREDQESHDQFFSLGNLRSGDWIDVRGYPDPTASGRIIAVRLEREDPQEATELRGRAESLAAPRFRIVGVNVETIPATTKFEDDEQDIDSATFFARASGLVVDVRGAWNGALLTASKVEIERDDDGAVAPPVTLPPVTPPPVTPPPGTGNRAPIANAGVAQSVATGATVALDGSASSDPDGDALTYSWSLQRPAGSVAVLAGATTSKPGFAADVAGSYVATLTVNDGKVTASASVTVTAQAPVAGPNGSALYTSRCAGCHGPISPIFKISAKSAQNIQDAINSNRGGMGSLSTLTAAEVQSIAAAITAANP
jgi:mono/diheme cytochrome c family protein